MPRVAALARGPRVWGEPPSSRPAEPRCRRADDFELGYDGDVTAGDDAHSLGDILASPLVVDTFPYAVHVLADFVLDGGDLFLVGGPGSFARWELELTQPARGDVFRSSGRLEVDAGGAPTFTTSGADVGATGDGHARVEIPLTFQHADLGMLLPGGQMYLSYHLEVEVGLGPTSEIGSASFSDPFTHRGHGDPLAAPIQLVPAGPAVAPEPAPLALLAPAVLLLRGRRRSDASRPSRCHHLHPRHGHPGLHTAAAVRDRGCSRSRRA